MVRPHQGRDDVLGMVIEKAQVSVALLVNFSWQLAGVFLLPFGSQYEAPSFAINWEFRDVEK